VAYENSLHIYEILCVEGATHVDKNGDVWSGNFKSWCQYRQLIDGNVCNKFEEK